MRVANYPIKMISEGSCDTKDWNNDAENSALHYKIKLHFNCLNCNNFHNITVFFY